MLQGYKSHGREIITCPYKCKRRTSLKRPDYAGNLSRLPTNIYILPFVEKMTKLRYVIRILNNCFVWDDKYLDSYYRQLEEEIPTSNKLNEGPMEQILEQPSEELTPVVNGPPNNLPRRNGVVYIQFSVNGVIKPAIVIKLCRRSAPNVTPNLTFLPVTKNN